MIFEDWAFELGPGPADEQGQSLVFVSMDVSVPAGAFASPPNIDISEFRGDLSFELAADATGSAEIRVVLPDDGGVANGGINQSEKVILTISALTDRIFGSRFDSD